MHGMKFDISAGHSEFYSLFRNESKKDPRILLTKLMSFIKKCRKSKSFHWGIHSVTNSNMALIYLLSWTVIEHHRIFISNLFMSNILAKAEKSRLINAGFRLTCRLSHCRFEEDICTTAQAPLAAEGWPSGKQRQANRSITLPLCPLRQIADSWLLFNLGAIAAGWKAKAALPLRAATLKQQAMPSGVAAKRQAAS